MTKGKNTLIMQIKILIIELFGIKISELKNNFIHVVNLSLLHWEGQVGK